MSADFLGETLDGGTYRITEHLRGTGSQLLFLATRSAHPHERFFASVIWAWKGVPVQQVRRDPAYRIPGIFDFEHVGNFDVQGDDEERNSHQRDYWAMLEKLPEGEWLRRVVNGALNARKAVDLGLQVGRILERTRTDGIILAGIRPDYVWIRKDGDRHTVTGLTARNHIYFGHTGRGCMHTGFLFERSYLAPEIYRREPASERSLVFSLAVMIAEWATGRYPFPDHWVGQSSSAIYEGRHAPLDLPAPLATLLSLALGPEPARRPHLAHFLQRLDLLSAELA